MNREGEEEKKEEVPAGTRFPEIATKMAPMPKTMRDQFAYGLSLKEEGNLYYKQKDYANAIKKYSKVRAFLKPFMPA